jgi:hypothetical protein
VYSVTLQGSTATLSTLFVDNAAATVGNRNSPQAGQQVTLALTDPDSNIVVPGSAPRFGRDFMLDSQGDQQQVYVHHPGTSSQTLTVLNLSQSVDDTAFATNPHGTLFATDAAHDTVDAISGPFLPGDAFVAATPGNANNAPPNPGPNFLGSLDLGSGAVSALNVNVTGTGPPLQPKGLIFVSTRQLCGEADERGQQEAG